MKILQLITLSELGGAQSVVVNLANELIKTHSVIVAAGEGDGKMWEAIDPRVTAQKCKYLQRAISPVKDFWALIELIKLYRKYKPDIIHLHSSKAGLLGRLAFPKKKIVYTVHGFDSIRVAHRKFLPLEKVMQWLCNSIVAVSRYDLNNLKNEGVKNNVTCVYNSIAQPNSIGIVKPEVFNKYSKVVLAIARVASPKRHDLFIEVSKRLPEYGFIWIGNQDPVDNIPSNCHFIGNIANAGAYCQFADVFCLMSDYEGLPMVILEAMSFAKPVIASNVGGISEIVQNNINGYVVENSIEKFAEAIVSVLSDQSKLDLMGKNSRKIFADNLTIDKMVTGYLAIYQALLYGSVVK